MWPQLLLISDDARDRRFAQQVALAGSFALREVEGREAFRRALALHPESIVLWNADNPKKYENISEVFEKYIPLTRIFAITESAAESNPHLNKNRTWGNHLLRRFPDSTIPVFVRMFQATLTSEARTLETYMPKGTPVSRIPLKRSTQKHAAIEAIQNHLQKKGIGGRMAALIAQAADELILNAVFDAPCGTDLLPTRHGLARNADFELTEREEVIVALSSTPGYLAVAVTDRFGSLRKSDLLDSLLPEDSTRLGLKRVHESGISLLFTGTERENMTAILFCPDAENYRAFRGGFHFLGVQIT